MGYSDDESMVRVDFFKESGKWYTTEAVKWVDYTGDIHAAFCKAVANATWDKEMKQFRYEGMHAVCLEPYHEHAHPLMRKFTYDDLSLAWSETS